MRRYIYPLVASIFVSALFLILWIGTSHIGRPVRANAASRSDLQIEPTPPIPSRVFQEYLPVLSSSSFGGAEGKVSDRTYATDVVLVKLRQSAQPSSRQAYPSVLTGLVAVQVKQLFPEGQARNTTDRSATNTVGLDRIYRVRLQPGSDVESVVKSLSVDPSVEYAEPDYVAQRAGVPNDPRLGEQWALNRIQIEPAWNVITGTANIVIAVVDSGIDMEQIGRAHV